MEVSVDTAWLMFIFGVVATFLTSLLKNRDWPSEVKVGIAAVVSAGFAALQLWLTGYDYSLTGDLATDICLVGSVIFTTATLLYKTLFERTALNRKIEDTRVLGPRR